MYIHANDNEAVRRTRQAARRAVLPRRRETLTVIVPIDAEPPGRKQELETLLKEIGNDIRNQRHIDFAALEDTHFLSWSILPGIRDECGREGPARLAFEANFDGPRGEFLDQLIRKVGGPLKELLYQHCGLPADADEARFKAFLLEHAVEATLPYESYAGLSASKIQNDARVHWRFHRLVTSEQLSRPAPIAVARDFEDHLLNREVDACFASIQRELDAARSGAGLPGVGGQTGGEPPLEYDAEPESWRTRLARWTPVRVLRCIPAIPAFVVGGALLVQEALSAAREQWRAFRKKGLPQPEVPPESAQARAQREKEEAAREEERKKQLEIQNREDHQVQNHLTHLAELKPGLLRPLVLRLVLQGWKRMAKYYFTDGNLAGIEGIHFARWIIIDGGRQGWPPPAKDGRPRRLSLSRKRHYLLFFSNYDGSWESYLDDFIDRASLGLTTIWCNTEGFPKPRLRWRLSGRLPSLSIQQGGNRDVEFKQWVRQHQIPTLTWYSRHPDKSVSNIRRNREIRAKAGVPMSSRKRSQWLQLL
jgi:hypothetical protein